MLNCKSLGIINLILKIQKPLLEINLNQAL
jgi:hypothetical protein